MRAHICEKFDISEGNVTVVCTFSQKDGDLSLTAIEITLSSSALMKNPRQIESYIEDGACKAEEHIFGKSITDPCLGWEKTEKLILDIADKL